MYVGNGQMVVATHTGGADPEDPVVQIQKIWATGVLFGKVR